MDNFLIGITGYKQTGKTTFAYALLNTPELLGASLQAFADEVKRDVHEMFEQKNGYKLSQMQIAGLKASCLGPMYQGYGQLCRTLYGDDFWIKRLEAGISTRAIVHDVRYKNEAEWIKSRGGLLIGLHGDQRGESDARDTLHPSEVEVPECLDMADIYVCNDLDYGHLIEHAIRISSTIVGVTPEQVPV